MIFKNAKLYQVVAPINVQNVEQKLSEFAEREPGSQELGCSGWGTVLGAVRAYSNSGNYLFKLTKQERILPSSVVNDELQKAVEDTEQETGAPVSKKARMEIKQGIIQRLLPRAFVRKSFTHGAYIPSKQLIIVNSPSDSKAEVFLAMLRKSLGSLPVLPFFRASLTEQLTDWIGGRGAPGTFELLEKVKLAGRSDEYAKAAFDNQDLTADEVIDSIHSGKFVCELAVSWDETLSCIICEDGTIKRIKFRDVITEQNDDIPRDQVEARFDADVALELGELARFTNSLITNLDEAA